jgi:CubicO group peptidase (beta-lactamase class C family)
MLKTSGQMGGCPMRILQVICAAAIVAGALFIPSMAGVADPLRRAQPEEVGMSSDRLARLGEVLGADVEAGRIPGAVVLVMRHGKIAYFEAVGLENTRNGAAMLKDSIFRIYSMTKPVVSVAVMMLWEEGRFDIDDPIAKYLPDLKDLKVAVVHKGTDGKSNVELEPAKRQPTIQQLLEHTGGLTNGSLPTSPDSPVRQMYRDANIGNPDETLAELVVKIGRLPLVSEPGTVWEYSRSTDVLARLVEVVSGMPIDRFLETRIFAPLGMKDTGFWASREKVDRLAEPFANDPEPGYPINLIEVTKPPKLLSGNGGLVSTAEDYTRFTQMLVNHGSFDGVRILGPETVKYMTSDQIGTVRGPLYLPGPGYGFGLGFAVRLSVGQAPYPGSEGDYSWGGAAGTIFWVDPKEDLTAVFMTQRFRAFVHYGRLIRTLVYQSIVH